LFNNDSLINQFKNKSSETNEPEKIIVCKQCDMSKLFFETSLKNPLYGVNSGCEVKDFSKILDAIGPVAL
jgi:hypothetical protein